MSRLKERRAPEAWDDLHRRASRMETMLHKYKARETHLAVGLTAVARAIGESNWKRASDLIDGLAAAELKDAVEFFTDRDLALRLAVQSVETHANTIESRAAIAQIKKLAPEAFEAPRDAVVS